MISYIIGSINDKHVQLYGWFGWYGAEGSVFLSGLWRTALDTRQAVTLDTTEGVKVKKRLVTGCV